MRRHRDEDAHGRCPGKKQRRRIASDDDEDEDEDEGMGLDSDDDDEEGDQEQENQGHGQGQRRLILPDDDEDEDEEGEEEEQEQENQGYGRGHPPRRAFKPLRQPITHVTKTKRHTKQNFAITPAYHFLSFFHYLPFLRPLHLTPTARNGCGLYSLVIIKKKVAMKELWTGEPTNTRKNRERQMHNKEEKETQSPLMKFVDL